MTIGVHNHHRQHKTQPFGAKAAALFVDGHGVVGLKRPGRAAEHRSGIEGVSNNETVLAVFAFTRAVLSVIIIGSVLVRGIDGVGSNDVLLTLIFLGVAGVGLSSVSYNLLLRKQRRPNHLAKPWAAILLDAALAIGVMAVIDAETSPLVWIALIVPVLETAVLFSMFEAGIVWVGLSLGFLALRLSSGFDGEAGTETFTLAIQQVLAVLLVSGPAAMLTDSTQQRIDDLADARKEADRLADRLRRIGQATSDMTRENTIDSVLDSVSRGAVTLGFDHADVVISRSDGSLISHGSHSTSSFRLPPVNVMTNEVISNDSDEAIVTITADDQDFAQLLHSHDVASGHAVQVSSSQDIRVVLRVWSERFPAGEQDLKALSLLAGHAREIHLAAKLLDEAKLHSAQLLHQVRHDGLTGLAHRDFVLQTLDEHIAGDETIALYFLDLDGFKEINDTLGHRAGDAALMHVADRLREIDRPDTLSGRMGGDEFVIVLTLNVFDTVDALLTFGEDVADAISTPFLFEGSEIHIGSSIGLAIYDDGIDSDQLISLADDAMYQAKRTGTEVHLSETSPRSLPTIEDVAS